MVATAWTGRSVPVFDRLIMLPRLVNRFFMTMVAVSGEGGEDDPQGASRKKMGRRRVRMQLLGVVVNTVGRQAARTPKRLIAASPFRCGRDALRLVRCGTKYVGDPPARAQAWLQSTAPYIRRPPPIARRQPPRMYSKQLGDVSPFLAVLVRKQDGCLYTRVPCPGSRRGPLGRPKGLLGPPRGSSRANQRGAPTASALRAHRGTPGPPLSGLSPQPCSMYRASVHAAPYVCGTCRCLQWPRGGTHEAPRARLPPPKDARVCQSQVQVDGAGLAHWREISATLASHSRPSPASLVRRHLLAHASARLAHALAHNATSAVKMVESAIAMAGGARQKFQETEEDRITRSAGNFPDFEKTMPALKHRLQFSLKDNLSSYLGSKNPFYSFVDPEKDFVWLFDNTAYQNRLGRWNAEFVAAYFVKDSGKDLGEVVAWVSDQVGLAEGDKARDTVAERIQPLLDAILPAHAVNVDLEGVQTRLGPSGRDGISTDELAVPGHEHKEGHIITVKALKVDGTSMKTTFAAPKGWAIISDVDDTIKKTLTSSPVGILKTTFAEDPEPIKGMPELYKHITQKLNNPPFWYLSASPYNLYPFLSEFRDTHYPHGTMILRDASWMNLAGFLANLTQGTQAYKVDAMEKIYDSFPKRKYICIGDSTQSDPEAYGEVYRKHPKWIGAIFIRKVTGVSEMDEGKKNDPERFEKAFKHVPKDIWHVFTDPSELYAKVDALPAAT
ncbi:hypothetical protein BCR34DRAFT_107300 [Clohesyomyces aquaticus]|uniref:Phosphatidate phosphatase APP1 catalytic domain-containing protein n=1 Tax=Clohesyomyces aquaticus TaxID=1231657 RepID=A0A1Y2A1S0_9PLEO|nr:hypothetical protein BCR34DRAFT_107300 [Clohesyomyces aquaticus]